MKIIHEKIKINPRYCAFKEGVPSKLLWEFIQSNIGLLKIYDISISLDVDDRMGFMLDVATKPDVYVFLTLNEVKAFISGIEVCYSLMQPKIDDEVQDNTKEKSK